MEISFLCKIQSGFGSGDSIINQLISFEQKVHEALESGREVLAVFIDVSKVAD